MACKVPKSYAWRKINVPDSGMLRSQARASSRVSDKRSPVPGSRSWDVSGMGYFLGDLTLPSSRLGNRGVVTSKKIDGDSGQLLPDPGFPSTQATIFGDK